MTKTALPAIVLAGLIAYNQPAPAQQDAGALQREGNSLAKSGLYHAALLRYREAAAAGADSPLYHYNLGIVYYRLDRLDDAIAELELARLDPALEAIATYNLGLLELARGERAAAAAQFRHVIDIGAQRGLRRSARERLAAIAGQNDTEERGREPAGATRRDSDNGRDGGFRISALARYAQDSNVYRSPSASYADLSDPAIPLVTPTVYSASFMPVDLLASYVMPNEAGDTEFSFGYALNGDFYDSEFANANRVSQRFSIGADIDLKSREGRRRRLRSSFYVRTHDETNFNPDDGLDRTLTGTDLADRFTYRGAGIAADYAHERGRFLFGFDINYERRQYEDAGLLPNYDHDYFDNRGFVDVRIGSQSEIGFELSRLRRVYDERQARDLSGAFSAGPDFLEYDYRGVGLSYRRFIGNALIAEVGVERLARTDLFVGYYDYTRDGLTLSLSYRPNPKLRVAGSIGSHEYDFPNAFAFNNPLGGARELELSLIEIELEYTLSRRLSLWLTLESDDSVATDAREAYDRSLATVGVKWRRR